MALSSSTKSTMSRAKAEDDDEEEKAIIVEGGSRRGWRADAGWQRTSRRRSDKSVVAAATLTESQQQQWEPRHSSRLTNIMQTEATFHFYTHPFGKDPVNLNKPDSVLPSIPLSTRDSGSVMPTGTVERLSMGCV